MKWYRIAAVSALLAGVMMAQSTDEKPGESKDPKVEKLMQTVVVTGVLEEIPLEEADRPVTVQKIGREQLTTSATWIDWLRLDPSLDIRQRGVNGTQADISIRGSTFGQTLVLVNGLRMNDPQSGHHNADIPVPLDSAERIEVLRGSGSSLYGSDAIGGVVNLVTGRPEAGYLRVRGGGGSFGTNEQRIDLGLVKGAVSNQTTLVRELSTGFIENRDYRTLQGASETSIKTGLGYTSILLGSSDRAFGAQGFYGNFPSWERTKSWIATLRQELGSRTDFAFGYRRHTDLFVLFRDNPPRYTNHHVKQGYQAALRRRDPLSQQVSVHYGAEGFYDDIVSNNLGNHTRGRGAVYAGVDARALRRFSFSVSAREEWYSGGNRQFSPTASASAWIGAKVKLRTSASRGFRLPTFTDLYYRDPATNGNPNLRPERAWSFDGGVDWYPNEQVRAEFTVFRRNERDVIDYVRTGAVGPFTATNFQQLNFTGIETGVTYQWRRRQMFGARYSWLEGARDVLAGTQSRYVFNYPRQQAILSWQGTLPMGLTGRTRLGVLERLQRDPYAVWDVYLSRGGRRFSPYVQLTNLTATRYEEIAGVRMPGRAVIVGVDWVVFGRR